MCKKLIFLSLVLAFALTASTRAANIIWVSDNKANSDPAADQGWVDLLRNNGHTVDYKGENPAVNRQYWRTLDAGKIAELNAADLIIVSRDTDSGNYASNAQEVLDWNGITTPLILQVAHIYRSSRWRWMNSTSVANALEPLLAVMTEHPIFDGVTLDASNQVQILTSQSSIGDGNVDPTNSYTLIATRSGGGADGVWIATWEPGVEFYPGSGQTPAGPRMYFALGGTSDVPDGTYNLTAEGEKLFLNAVAYYTGVRHNATNPDPRDGADVPPEGKVPGGVFMLLSFEPGEDAIAHTAYFSDNLADVEGRVEDVNLGAPPFPVYMPTSYYVGLDDTNLPAFAREPLDTGITYYWVVDEFNGVETFPGKVWSFRIIPEEAWDPTPADDELVIADPCVDLSWQMGAIETSGHSISYDIFWGTDEATVATATTPEPGNHVTVAKHTIGPLLGDTDYYWRVNTLLSDVGPPFATDTVEGVVWHFKTLPIVDIVEVDLVAWWKLDGGLADGIAFDSSGYGNHGTIEGDPEFVEGYVDNALDFDGDGDYVDCGNKTVLNQITANITVAAWIQVRTFDTTWQAILTKGDNSWRIHRGGTTNTINWAINGTGGSIYGTTNVNNGEWHHVAGVYDGTGKILYVNGQLEASDTEAGVTLPVSGYNVNIGENAQATGRHWSGLIDDARIYRRALSAKEIQILAGRLGASNPDPANGATDVSRTPTLSWTPGAFPADTGGNRLYYGEDISAVLDRTADNVFLDNPPYTPLGTLDLGANFYWAVDTVNGIEIWPGDLWSFTAIGWISVDDMESYTPWTTPGNNIFEIWLDGFGDCAGSGNGTGAVLTENADPIFGGVQSMKYDFDNDGTVYSPCDSAQVGGRLKYSKAELQIDDLASGIGTNWTIQGVKALSLRFYGNPLNIVEPMWVQLRDSTKGYGAKVTYGDYADEDPIAITEESWHEWFIDMADFDVDANNLVSVTIGFGNENGTGLNGNGAVYFDDFRLYTPKCFPSRHTAEMAKADFAPLGAPDCRVDYKELDVMADDWLLGDALVTAAARPTPDPNLVAWWKFDDGSGATAINSSGTASALTLSGAITWEDGISGGAVHFRGVGSGTGTLGYNANAITVCAWVNHDVFVSGQVERYITVGSEVAVIRKENDGRLHFYIMTGGSLRHLWVSDVLTEDQWHYVVGAWDGLTQRLYIDGVLKVWQRPGGVLGTASSLNVSSSGEPFNGMLDDVRIYDYALTHGEVLSLAGVDTLYVPVPSSAEIYEGEAEGSRVVNFKDYAELMDSWLVEIKYPQ